ncbi:sugar transferase [Halomonas sp. 328]|uniref:sugar transferase n=1 Tax=Halomonas sp. 328 TaxID=2776704 RepID=UPI001E4F593E|nr:sugar transferase [Halomonas sp. 328]
MTTQTLIPRRRHSRLFERLLLRSCFPWLLIMLASAWLPALWSWGWGFWREPMSDRVSLLVALAGTSLLAQGVICQLNRYPGVRPGRLLLPVYGGLFGTGALVHHGVQPEAALLPWGLAVLVAVSTATLGYRLARRYRRRKLAVVPLGRAPALCRGHRIDWRVLSHPGLQGRRVDGVVADLHVELPEPWERFLAECSMHGIPVYHVGSLYEQLSGRVPVDHLQENRHGQLQPAEGYEALKRCLDITGVLLLLSLVLPVMVVVAVAIRLETPGPIIFTQQRMGYLGRPFTLYKFRSMTVDGDPDAPGSDARGRRITRVGRVIRKFRIDEVPQLYNVLRGEMSLIGPRPETLALARRFEEKVPFFAYRHVVRPGVSGWAQVEQGYVTDHADMIRKLEHDFYYIKHVSFWLDLLIGLRTLRTVLTGKGAR